MSEEEKVVKEENEVKEEVNLFLKWRQANPDQPLFLPPNSVRAIMVLFLLMIVGYLAIVNKSIDQNQVMQMLATVVGFYFGARANESKTQ